MTYTDPAAVWTAPTGSVKVDPHDPAFRADSSTDEDDPSLPAIYLFSNSPDGDGPAYAMAEDGNVLGSHWCSHWGYMRHDLHERADQLARCQQHYPDGYRLIVLTEPGSTPPAEVVERNRLLGEVAAREASS